MSSIPNFNSIRSRISNWNSSISETFSPTRWIKFLLSAPGRQFLSVFKPGHTDDFFPPDNYPKLLLPVKLTPLILFMIFNFHLSSAQGYLHRNGKYIYDGAGNEVILRGIGTGNWMLQEGYMMQTSDIAGTQREFRAKLEATIGEEKTDSFYTVWLHSHFRRIDVDSMKSWGFNSVRVAMHYKWFTPPIEEEPVPGEITWLDTGFTLLDSLLDWCGDNEMYLILDLHGAPGGQGKDANISDYDPSKPSLWESQANKDKTIALWRKLAERYSDEPWIGGYDLINETNWSFPEGNNSKMRELMVNITNAIREVDPNHLIFVEGNGFANDFSGLTPPWDDNMAYSFHKYWSYNNQESIQFALSLRSIHNVPLWLGESGENSNVWFTSLIELLEKNRIGWSWWPVKKPGINNPLNVTVNPEYRNLINYWKGTAPDPGTEAAFQAVLGFAQNHLLENCRFQKDVVDAMIRQPVTRETVPFKEHHTGLAVFAVDFDMGRSSYAYFDVDSANFHLNTGSYTNWNQGYSYRNDGVDIEACSDAGISNGYNVGWTQTGEWMEYTIISDTTAGFSLDIRSASGSGGSTIHFESRGRAVSPALKIPATGGWQTWKTTTFDDVILEKGVNKIRLYFDQGGSNLNYFRFYNPVSLENISFKSLYASSSSDGALVTLTLNKEVTSGSSAIYPGDFSLTIDNAPVQVLTAALNSDDPSIINLSLGSPLYYGGVIKLSYSGSAIKSGSQVLDNFSAMDVANNLPFRFNIPARIQAEDYSFNYGFTSETCNDLGGGLDMGYANPGDYLDYRIYVPESRYYTINFRVASTRSSSQLVIMTGEGNSFSPLDTLVIPSTGGWQSWQTIPVTVPLVEGRYSLRLYVRSGEFNTNWFQFIPAWGLGVETSMDKQIKLFPNPCNDRFTIDLSGIPEEVKEVSVYNSPAQKILSIKKIIGTMEVNTVGLPEGLYFVRVETESGRVISSKILIR